MTDEQTDAKWFARTMTDCPDPKVRLFCFPHGGAGASAFREWQATAGDDVEIIAVQLPGHETRIMEPVLHSIPEICAELAGPVTRRAGSLPFAFLGHSMGALVAFELSRLLRDEAVRPSALTVSGAAAPQLPVRNPPVHTLPREELMTHSAMLGGTPKELLASEHWAEFILPVLRADFEACETYRVPDGEPLSLPMLVLGGADDPVAPPAEVRPWTELTSGPTAVEILPGEHFFLFDHASVAIRRTVQTAMSAAI